MNAISEVGLSYQLLNKISTTYYLTPKPFKNKIGLSENDLNFKNKTVNKVKILNKGNWIYYFNIYFFLEKFLTDIIPFCSSKNGRLIWPPRGENMITNTSSHSYFF